MRGFCLQQTMCCPACDSDTGHADHDAGEEGPNKPCARARHGDGVEGPNWGEYNALRCWCGREGCLPQPCPNAPVCRVRWPPWLLDAHDGRCLNCNVDFGRNLTFFEVETECPVCYEAGDTHVNLPACSHAVCVTCFRRLAFQDNGWARPVGAALVTCPLCRAEYRAPYDTARRRRSAEG
jgi:hypothetical protein